jgi:hypothetical protein
MAHDEHITPRPIVPPTSRPIVPPVEPRVARPRVDESSQTEPGWEHRHERRDRLSEGQNHPLHHGRTLHGPHAADGAPDEHDEVADVPRRTWPPNAP